MSRRTRLPLGSLPFRRATQPMPAPFKKAKGSGVSVIGGGGGGELLPHIVTFGHSLIQQEFNIYDGVDALTGGDPTTATSSFKTFQQSGRGGIINGLFRAGNRLLHLVVQDPTGTNPAPTGISNTFPNYLLGDTRAQSGSQISHTSDQLDWAKAAGLSFQAGVIWTGTNELPWPAGRDTAFAALLAKAKSLFPGTKWLVLNIAPTATGGGTTDGRNPANVDAANVMIATAVSAAGSEFTLGDVCTPLRARTGTAYGSTADYQNDLVHFLTPGGGVVGKVVGDWLGGNFAPANPRRAMLKGGGYVKEAVRLFNSTTTTTWSQPAAGTRLSGTRPAAIAVVSASPGASFASTCAFSIVPNPDTAKGGNAVRIDITPGGSNTSEQLYMVLGSVLNVAGSLANKPWTSGVRIIDNNDVGLLSYSLDTYDNTLKADRLFHADVSAEPLGATGPRTGEIWTPIKTAGSDLGQMEINLTIRWNPAAVGAAPFYIIFDLDLDEVFTTAIQAPAIG